MLFEFEFHTVLPFFPNIIFPDGYHRTIAVHLCDPSVDWDLIFSVLSNVFIITYFLNVFMSNYFCTVLLCL